MVGAFGVIPGDLARGIDAPRMAGAGGYRVVEGSVDIDWHDTGSSVIVSLAENVAREAGLLLALA